MEIKKNKKIIIAKILNKIFIIVKQIKTKNQILTLITLSLILKNSYKSKTGT